MLLDFGHEAIGEMAMVFAKGLANSNQNWSDMLQIKSCVCVCA
jgi:hypothetical protein